MVLIRENLDKAPIWQPMEIPIRVFDIPYDLALPALQQHGTRIPNDDPEHPERRFALVLYGVKLNDLSPLWPVAHFREAMMVAAKAGVRQLEAQEENYQLATPESDLRVYGPYAPRALHHHDNAFVRGTRGLNLAVPGFSDFQIIGDYVAHWGRTPEWKE